MKFTCPQCQKQHTVTPQLAGKRAKCACGEILQLPQLPDDPYAVPVAAEPAKSPAPAQSELLRFEYGAPQKWFFRLGLACGPGGLLFLLLGIFANDQLTFGGQDLPPWAALLLCLMFASLGIGMCGVTVYMTMRHRKQPYFVTLSATEITVPSSQFRADTKTLDLARLTMSVKTAPATQMLNLKHPHLKTSLNSAYMPDPEGFGNLVAELRRRGVEE